MPGERKQVITSEIQQDGFLRSHGPLVDSIADDRSLNESRTSLSSARARVGARTRPRPSQSGDRLMREARSMQIPSLLSCSRPGIDDLHSSKLEIGHVPRDDYHSVHHGCCGNQRVPFGPGVGDMQSRTFQGDGGIDG